MPMEKPWRGKGLVKDERDQLGWMSGLFTRMRRSPQQVTTKDDDSSKASRLMRRNKAKNLHLCLSDIMRKMKHSFKKEKPQHDNRLLLWKKRRFQRSLSTKDHFFLERMTSVSHEMSHQGHYEEKHLSEMLNYEDFDQSLATSKETQRRFVSLPEYSSPFRSPGRRTWDQDSTLLSDDFFVSETIADDSITTKEMETASSSKGSSPFAITSNQIVDKISEVEAYNGERQSGFLKETSHEENLPQLSLLSVASQSPYISKTEEYKLVLEPLFIGPAIGEAKRQPMCNQLEERNETMDEKESVFKYVKAVLDAIDSNWEELYLKTEFSDQLLNPALISNIPFYPNQLGADHELLFDCINEVLFKFCRFPQVLSSGVDSVNRVVQEEVYGHLQVAQSLDQIVGEDMAKPRNWLNIRCDLECIGFEASEIILNELLEELMLGLCI